MAPCRARIAPRDHTQLDRIDERTTTKAKGSGCMARIATRTVVRAAKPRALSVCIVPQIGDLLLMICRIQFCLEEL